MKLLVIRAHPCDSKMSRTMAMADAFVQGFLSTHHQARIDDVHLYDTIVPEIDSELLDGWGKLRHGTPLNQLSPSQQAKITMFDHYTEQFMTSDVIVVANPLWNLSIPTRLKAWIDTICRVGVTFRYSPEGQAIGLASHKTVVHLQSSGGNFNGTDPASTYLRTIFTFLGCDYRQVRAEDLDHLPAEAPAIMEKALEECRTLGASI